MNLLNNQSDKGRYKQIMIILTTFFLLTACVNHIDDDDDDKPSDQTFALHVTTRNTEIKVTYPIHIYAFNAAGKQAGMITVNNADNDCSLSLPEGNYHLVALAGTAGCVLPEIPTRTGSITLPASNYSTSALMMGSADVALSTANVEANILLTYRMARIELSLNDIPAAVTAVKVSFSPLYPAINFEGSCTGEGNRAGIACTKEGGVWKAPVFYTLPGSGQSLTLSIEMTDAEGTKTYGYTYTGKLEAGFPYVLSGSYKQGFNVNGTITAEGWGEAKSIGFTFGGADGGTCAKKLLTATT